MDINPDKCNLKYFIGLIKIKQAPFEDDLIAKMQAKVDWIKKTSTYDLNQRQKDSLQKDKDLVVAVETYISIWHGPKQLRILRIFSPEPRYALALLLAFGLLLFGAFHGLGSHFGPVLLRLPGRDARLRWQRLCC